MKDPLDRGAELLCGGGSGGGGIQKGYFFLPTVLDRADHKMKIMREELLASSTDYEIQDR